MNAAENWICASSLWRYFTTHRLLPWVLSGTSLGDHLLEIGAGYGAATAYLNTQVPRVTSLEYNHNSVRKWKSLSSGTAAAVCGDASNLPFAGQTFTSALAILVLHHLKSTELQDQMFAEAFRVLRPGGIFVAFEIMESWFHRIGHIRSTFTPVAPHSVSPRLTAAGFSGISVDARRGTFRLAGIRPA